MNDLGFEEKEAAATGAAEGDDALLQLPVEVIGFADDKDLVESAATSLAAAIRVFAAVSPAAVAPALNAATAASIAFCSGSSAYFVKCIRLKCDSAISQARSVNSCRVVLCSGAGIPARFIKAAHSLSQC